MEKRKKEGDCFVYTLHTMEFGTLHYTRRDAIRYHRVKYLKISARLYCMLRDILASSRFSSVRSWETPHSGVDINNFRQTFPLKN